VKEPIWIKSRAVLRIHDESLAAHGGPEGVRDSNALEAALARPRNVFAYAERDLTLFELAAAYAYGIARSHPFVDGNKRTAAIVSMAFLDRNGVQIAAPQPEVYLTFTRLAAGKMTEAELAKWFEHYAEPRVKPARRKQPRSGG
jgi:death on curing protein